ncbi:MAG: PH domain-containing protein [bacterium]|nr:PH domain-containing protein [bacterium]
MEQSKFEHLGHKSLIIFILGMSPPLVLILALGAGMTVFQNELPEEAKPYLGTAYSLLFIFFILLSIVIFAISYLKYITYKFALDENALHIERGILNREIISIPYRQIQNINIDRNLFNRLFSLSNLTITTAAHEESDEEGTNIFEAEGVLPYLDKIRAAEIQSELMKRTNVEKVIAVNQSTK